MDVKTQTGASADTDTTDTNSEGESWGSFARFVLIVVALVLAFRIFMFSLFSIPSESMLPQLMNGDYLAAKKWSYGFSGNSLPFDLGLPDHRYLASPPERGDVVIFKHPIDRTDYIKRVIALPGDSVAMVDGQIVLNGTPVPKEPIADFEIPVSLNTGCSWGAEEIEGKDGQLFCRYKQFRETLPSGVSYNVIDFGITPSDTTAPVIIPEGMMFVMGDNRDNSRDSRFEARSGDAVGIVSQDALVGEAAMIVWSTDGSAEWIKPWTWFSAARWHRIGTGL